jgi:hypothetical protein
LIAQVKAYANQQNTSVSDLVEAYFKRMLDSRKKGLVDLFESLPKSDIDENLDLRKAYFENKGTEYGG